MTSQTFVFLAQFIFSLADNDTDISKIHLNKAEQVIKLDFYLLLQNTENFALSMSRIHYSLPLKNHFTEPVVYFPHKLCPSVAWWTR